MTSNLIEALYASKAFLATFSEKITKQLDNEHRVKCGSLEAIHMYKRALSDVEDVLTEYAEVPEVTAVIAYLVATRRSIRTAPYHAVTRPSLTKLTEDINTNLMECIEWLDFAHAAVAKQHCTTEEEV